MTWGEWVNSSYNTGGYSVNKDGIICSGSNCISNPNLGKLVSTTNIIEANTTYRESLYTGGSNEMKVKIYGL